MSRPVDPRPVITFKVDAGYTAADGDFMEGDEIKIGVVANQNLITKKLSKFTLVRSIAALPKPLLMKPLTSKHSTKITTLH